MYVCMYVCMYTFKPLSVDHPRFLEYFVSPASQIRQRNQQLVRQGSPETKVNMPYLLHKNS